MLKKINFLIILAMGLAACNGSSDEAIDSSNKENNSQAMIGSWSAAPYGPYPFGPLSEVVPDNIMPGTVSLARFENNQAIDQSFRMIVNPTLSGKKARIRLSNLKGDRPIRFESVSLAKVLPQLPVQQTGTSTSLSFNGHPFVIIPVGQEAVSDFVDFDISAQKDVAISFHIPGESGPMTWHAVSFGPQYVSSPRSGDVSQNTLGLQLLELTTGWFFVSGLDVINPEATGSIVALGDSITDGFLQFLNTRWTDHLAGRINRAGLSIGILNQGINSNTVLINEPENFARGSAAEARFDRDVLSRPGVKGVIIFEGTNDLGQGTKAGPLIAGINRLINRAKAADLCVFLGTITPRADWLLSGNSSYEVERLKVNQWIRNDAVVDGVIDFDKALEMPGFPGLPNPLLYIPDFLHPNSLGFITMGEVVDIHALQTACGV